MMSGVESASPEIQKADPAARRKLVLWFAAAVPIAAAAIFFRESWMNPLVEWAFADKHAIAFRTAVLFGAIGAFSALPALWMAGYLWRYSRRIESSRRYPPLESSVATDTKVYHDERAVRRARMFQALAALLTFAAIGLAYQLWRAWKLLAAF
jgi:hypothetical protein